MVELNFACTVLVTVQYPTNPNSNYSLVGYYETKLKDFKSNISMLVMKKVGNKVLEVCVLSPTFKRLKSEFQ
jgi:hypothetical protein